NSCSQAGLASNERNVIKKIENGKVICEKITIAGLGTDCGDYAGYKDFYFVRGYQNGELVCADPCEELTEEERSKEVPVACPSGSGTMTYKNTFNCDLRSWGSWQLVEDNCVPTATP